MSAGILEKFETKEASATTETAAKGANHSAARPLSAAADAQGIAEQPAIVKLVRLVQVTRLPSTPDGDEQDLGFVPGELLMDLIRIAYPAGVYACSEWEGYDEERETFLVGGPIPRSWSPVTDLMIAKTTDGHVSVVDLREQQECDALEMLESWADEQAGVPR